MSPELSHSRCMPVETHSVTKFIIELYILVYYSIKKTSEEIASFTPKWPALATSKSLIILAYEQVLH